MKRIFILVFCLSISSCNFISKEVPEKEALLEERLQEINWSEPTRYPSVSSCDSILDKIKQKNCFFDFITTAVQERLAADTLSVLYPEIEFINVKVIVNPDATVIFEPYFKENTYESQKIDSILKVRLQNFPKIEPAQKEGIPVKSEFILPIVLKIE